MPWWPIMMPSEAVGAPKICGTPPAARMPFVRLAGQAVEVGVAGGDVAEERGDADHRPGEVVVEEADGAEHGAVGGAAHALGGQSAVALGVGRHGTLLRGRGVDRVVRLVATLGRKGGCRKRHRPPGGRMFRAEHWGGEEGTGLPGAVGERGCRGGQRALAKGGFGQITGGNLAKPPVIATPCAIAPCAAEIGAGGGFGQVARFVGQTPLQPLSWSRHDCYPALNPALRATVPRGVGAGVLAASFLGVAFSALGQAVVDIEFDTQRGQLALIVHVRATPRGRGPGSGESWDSLTRDQSSTLWIIRTA